MGVYASTAFAFRRTASKAQAPRARWTCGVNLPPARSNAVRGTERGARLAQRCGAIGCVAGVAVCSRHRKLSTVVRKAGCDSGFVSTLLTRADNTLLRELRPESNPPRKPSTESRAVSTGHYVAVSPEPLPDPELVAFSPDMCFELGLDAAEVDSVSFIKVLSGSVDDGKGNALSSWATPYAVSVAGHAATNSPFGMWGYGDGRAISIGEFLGNDNQRWELQLKGGGRTPFARRFDGRAALRSSVREFLASESMHALGVPTTRALSLIVSGSEKIARPWYTPPGVSRSTRGGPHAPSCLLEEPAAVLCRCSPSFLRVGHVELFSFRPDRNELISFIEHALTREYPHLVEAHMGFAEALVAMHAEFVKKQAHLVAEWLRVGFVQGNMNSDNCLLGGRTLDYGPFGFMENYDPAYQPFISDGRGNYVFDRQPEATQQNAATLANALLEAIPQGEERDRCAEMMHRAVVEDFPAQFRRAHADNCRRKLGLAVWDDEASKLWSELLRVMEVSKADFTMLFRTIASQDVFESSAGIERLRPAMGHDRSDQGLEDRWRDWLQRLELRVVNERQNPTTRLEEMRRASPKYIPRNWILFEAYSAAERGDYRPVRGLLKMLQQPYEEQPEFETAYFRQTPEWARDAGGLAFMT